MRWGHVGVRARNAYLPGEPYGAKVVNVGHVSISKMEIQHKVAASSTRTRVGAEDAQRALIRNGVFVWCSPSR